MCFLQELAVAAAYESFPDVLKSADVIHFVDNQGALGILVSGSSSNPPMGKLAHDTAAAQAAMRARVFYEYVESAANISDLPSRGQASLAARMLRERFRLPVWLRPLYLPSLRAHD